MSQPVKGPEPQRLPPPQTESALPPQSNWTWPLKPWSPVLHGNFPGEILAEGCHEVVAQLAAAALQTSDPRIQAELNLWRLQCTHPDFAEARTLQTRRMRPTYWELFATLTM